MMLMGLSSTYRIAFPARLLAAAALSLVVSPPLPPCPRQNSPAAPTQIAPALKVDVRIVLVDVFVTDKKGDPVAGLPKESFDVLEDGVPQAVSFFEEHRETQPQPYSAAVHLAPNSAESLPPNTYANSQAIKASDSVNVLLLDWLNTQPPDQSYVRGQVIKYLRTVPPGTRLAIFALVGNELRIVQGFTTESGVLLAALNGKNAAANPQSGGLLATESQKASDKSIIEMMIGNNAAPIAIAAVQASQASTTATRTGDRAKLTLQALQDLERYLSAIPGRKNVFWFAGSFPISVFPGSGPASHFAEELQRTAKHFGPDRIAIYPISAEGANASAPLDPSEGLTNRLRVAPAGTSDDAGTAAGSNQAAMEALAKETGGEAFYNTNGLDREITRAVDDAAHYYTLTYTPSNAQKDGRFRNIQVKLAEGNYKLSYRRGYFAEGPNAAPNSAQTAAANPASADDPLLGLMRFGMPDFDQIAYKVRVAPAQPQPTAGAAKAGVNADLKGLLTRYDVDFTIPLRGLKLQVNQDGGRGLVELMLVAYKKNGMPLNLVVAKNEFSVPQRIYESAQNVEIHARQEIDLPLGSVYLRAGLYEPATGNVGTIEVPLSVNPPPGASPSPAKVSH